MRESWLNEEQLPGNYCYGCGLSNTEGLRIEVARDDRDGNRLVGTFVPRETMTGFPGVVHGGAIYTALDCLATWTASTLRPENGVAWVLRSAAATYHKPARAGEPLSLSGFIKEQGTPGKAVVVHAEARDSGGDLVAEGDFKIVPLPVERLRQIVGVAEIPENWKRFLRVE